MSTPDAHKAMEREVVALVREFVSRFGRASMDGPRPEPPAGMRVELSCAVPGTVRVVLYPSDHDIDIHMGEDTWIELPRGKKGSAERLQEVREILEAVVHGRYEEMIWRLHGKIVKSRAVLYGADGKAFLRPREWHGLSALVPDPRAKRIRIAYEPYS